jgi:hypothetical protein
MNTCLARTITVLALLFVASPGFAQPAPEIKITEDGFDSSIAGQSANALQFSLQLAAIPPGKVRLSIPLLGAEGTVPYGWTAGACRLGTETPCVWRTFQDSNTVTLNRDDLKRLLVREPVTIHLSTDQGFPFVKSRLEWAQHSVAQEPPAAVLNLSRQGWLDSSDALQAVSTLSGNSPRGLVVRNATFEGDALLFIPIKDVARATGDWKAIRCPGGDSPVCAFVTVKEGKVAYIDLKLLDVELRTPLTMTILREDLSIPPHSEVTIPLTVPSQPTLASGSAEREVVEVELSEIGPSVKFRSPRTAPQLLPVADGSIRLRNVTTDRMFVIRTSLTPTQARRVATSPESGFSIKDGQLTGRVGPGASVDLPFVYLRGAEAIVALKLAFEFALEDRPVNDTVYIRVSEGNTGVEGPWRFSGSGALTATRTPDFEAFNVDRTYDNASTRRTMGDVEITATRRFSEWLEVRATATGQQQVGLRSTTSRSAQFQTVWARLFLPTGVTVTGGRFAWLKPADGLAMSFGGDMLQVTFPVKGLQSIGLGVLIDKSASPNGRGDYRVAAEVGPFGGRNHSALRSLTLSGVFGEKRKEQTRFWTTGGVLRFGNSAGVVSGSLAGFLSGRYRLATDQASDRGWIWQGTLDWGLMPEAGTGRVRRVVGVRVIQGSSDQPDSPQNEGYSGETAAFSTGGLFVPNIASRLNPEVAGFGTTLSNMTFLSLGFNDTTWSPLEWIADLLGVAPPDRQARFFQLRYQVHSLRQRWANAQRNLGSELILSMGVTAPARVEWAADIIGFRPSGQFDERFGSLPVKIAFRTKIKF